MLKEWPSSTPDMTPQMSSIENGKHEKRGMLFSAIAVVSTAGACANLAFALPALAAYVAAVLEFRKVPSMNSPKG